MIRFFLLLNRSGKARLAKYYTPLSDEDKKRLEDEVYRLIVNRDSKFTNFIEFKTYKLVYRRYAGLYFVFAVDPTDNELLYLESIHLFVEVGLPMQCRGGHDSISRALGSGPAPCRYLGCEAPHSFPWPLRTPRVPARHPTSHPSTCALQILDHYFGNVCELDLVFGFHKVYCLLDEFVIGGEIQETSKKAGWGQGLGVGLAESKGSQPQQPWCGRTTTVI
ncbi:AP2S2 [Auxenochlorella protothecoides x Auxenochlorella symbiontica]